MSADPLPATLSFLTDAAHLLLLASPQTSAHLMSQRNSLMFNNGLDLNDVQRQRVCGCCGHIMVPGHGDSFKMDSGKMARRKKTKSSKTQEAKEGPPRTGCRKTLTCSKCGRYTRIQLPPPVPIARRRPNQTSRHSVVASASIKTTTTTTMTTTTTTKMTTTATVRAMAEPPPPILSSGSAGAPRAAASSSMSANASSKKRAKNRKQGLQALLQQSTSSKPQAGLGLSLADFMQN
ncbi:hypothetical protein F5B17DRAFT_57805 [Nemania serpens]|nr:hypothetical protein F5B17DRAFT_57805 [Nemania serpens]